jgi:hypothetical protein
MSRVRRRIPGAGRVAARTVFILSELNGVVPDPGCRRASHRIPQIAPFFFSVLRRTAEVSGASWPRPAIRIAALPPGDPSAGPVRAHAAARFVDLGPAHRIAS